MIKCVAFDMDDTLYDEIDYYRSGFEAVSVKISADFNLSADKIFETLWRIFCLDNQAKIFNRASEELALDFGGGYIKSLVTFFRSHQPKIEISAPVIEMLDKFKSRYKLGLVTDGFLPAQQLKVKALGIEKYFDSIVYTEQLGRENWKPAAAGFEKLLFELKIPAAECVYIGDNLEKDFISPNKMGFKTIRIERKNRIHFGKAPDDEALADYNVNSIAEIIETVGKIDCV